MLGEIFVQVLIFMYFTLKINCDWNIFDKRYPLCEVEFIKRGFIKFLR